MKLYVSFTELYGVTVCRIRKDDFSQGVVTGKNVHRYIFPDNVKEYFAFATGENVPSNTEVIYEKKE